MNRMINGIRKGNYLAIYKTPARGDVTITDKNERKTHTSTHILQTDKG